MLASHQGDIIYSNVAPKVMIACAGCAFATHAIMLLYILAALMIAVITIESWLIWKRCADRKRKLDAIRNKLQKIEV